MSETLVGLTIVSIGTSLPELVTSVVAARKNEVDMALTVVVRYPAAASIFISPALASASVASIAWSCSSSDRPAIARILNPSAASVAVNFVEAPSSFALSASMLISSVVFPIVAATPEIAYSKSEPTLIA